jgi:5'-methylthioadenosine phosphorylase
MGEWTIGIIGGSGLAGLDGLEDGQEIAVETPWGRPSDSLTLGRLHGRRFVFLPRHERGHAIPPSEVNYRANIDALKRAGCTDVVAISAIGSLREELPPGRFVVVDQLVDRTFARASSFFGPGFVAHVSMADPVCPRLSALVAAAAAAAGAEVTRGGTYVAIEGPSFSSRAESRLYRTWGCDVVGMTALPEAKLAREAELPYALVGMVTDWDGWRDEAAAVAASDVLAQVAANAGTAGRLVERLARALPPERSAAPADTALDGAVVTAREARDPAMLARLDAVCRGWVQRGSA